MRYLSGSTDFQVDPIISFSFFCSPICCYLLQFCIVPKDISTFIYLFIWFFKYGSMVDLRPVNLVSSLRTNDVTICGKWVWLERAMRTLTKIEIYCHSLPVVKRNSFFRCRQNNRVSLYGQLIQFDRCDLFIAVNWIACQINLKRIRY